MSMKQWAVKPGELGALDDDDLALFAARCALRVEPWAPQTPLWLRGLVAALGGGGGGVGGGNGGLARALRQVDSADDVDGDCARYACDAVVAALDVAGAAERKARLRAAIDAAKLANSIFAVLAHSGRAGVSVDVTSPAAWGATRADIDVVAGAAAWIAGQRDPVRALRELGPLWPDDAWPAWSLP